MLFIQSSDVYLVTLTFNYQLEVWLLVLELRHRLSFFFVQRWMPLNKYMLFAGWEVRMVKNCDQGLENAARGRRPRAAFSSPSSQFFTIQTDPKPANNMFIFFLQ